MTVAAEAARHIRTLITGVHGEPETCHLAECLACKLHRMAERFLAGTTEGDWRDLFRSLEELLGGDGKTKGGRWREKGLRAWLFDQARCLARSQGKPFEIGSALESELEKLDKAIDLVRTSLMFDSMMPGRERAERYRPTTEMWATRSDLENIRKATRTRRGQRRVVRDDNG